MKLTLDIINKIIKYPHDLKRLADELTDIGFESEVDGDFVDIEIPANRGDLQSALGLGLELKAFYGYEIQNTDINFTPPESKLDILKITPSAQPFVEWDYLLKISGYQPMPSPSYIQKTLVDFGYKPKDLIVDLTNYATFLIGAPTHAFDFDSIKDGLVLDLSHKDETIELLNGEIIILPEGCLIQRSGQKIVDLVGVIGGAESQFRSKPEIIIQAAGFTPQKIRYNSKQTKIVTEASYRYERGVDPSRSQLALAFIATTLNSLQPNIRFESKFILQPLTHNISIDFKLDYIESLLGIKISEEILARLANLGFDLDRQTLKPTSYRKDITCLADIAEEIARLIGYNNLPRSPLTAKATTPNIEYKKIRTITAILIKHGFTELKTQAFSAKYGKIGPINPLSSEQRYLRPSLVEGITRTVSKNQYLPKARFFEIGHIFNPEEKIHFALALDGYKESAVNSIIDKLAEDLKFDKTACRHLTPEADFNLKSQKYYYLEVDLDSVEPINDCAIDISTMLRPTKDVSKYPPIIKDVTFLMSEKDVDNVINHSLSIPHLIVAEVIDIYQDNNQTENQAITFRFILQSLADTLSDDEVESLFNQYFDETALKRLKLKVK